MKVLVAMSGGVDSTVAAALLKEQGYEVVGGTMKLFCYSETPMAETSCCSAEAIEEARRACALLGVPHYLLNLEAEFEREVVSDFVSEYSLGRTPNPCIVCNAKMKFGAFLEKAMELGCSKMATGHYARVALSGGGHLLLKGRDARKDQSYALWNLTQEQLARSLFPLGDLTKEEVRARARALGLRNADKAESQEACFVPDGDYAAFVGKRKGSPPGDIVDRRGRTLGRHAGIARYTIGQRSGLGIALGRPVYVTAIDAARNEVRVGEDEELLRRDCQARHAQWISGAAPRAPLRALCKVRYQHAGQMGTLYPEGDRVRVRFDQPVRAITPGQSVVFYREDEVLGGGIISSPEGEP